jgi:broad specificity phosphatase PhoE
MIGTIAAVELILVRHGQPAWSTPDGRGRNDPGLTDLGHAQAKLVATRLANPDDFPAYGPIDVLAVSPAVRAQETAAPVREALGMEGDTLDWLWEIRNPPEWEGDPVEDIEAAFAEIRTRDLDAMWDGIPGGEPARDFHARVIGGVDGFLGSLGATPTGPQRLWELGDDAPERVVAVAHAGTNSTIVAHLLGLEPTPWELDRFAMGHASVAVLETVPLAGAHLWSLRALGDAAHLPVPERTA